MRLDRDRNSKPPKADPNERERKDHLSVDLGRHWFEGRDLPSSLLFPPLSPMTAEHFHQCASNLCDSTQRDDAATELIIRYDQHRPDTLPPPVCPPSRLCPWSLAQPRRGSPPKGERCVAKPRIAKSRVDPGRSSVGQRSPYVLTWMTPSGATPVKLIDHVYLSNRV